jgi:hypothetical protein
MRPPERRFLKVLADGPDFRSTMLTVTENQPATERPTLRQSDVPLELIAAESSPAMPLSLQLGVSPARAVGDETQPS